MKYRNKLQKVQVCERGASRGFRKRARHLSENGEVASGVEVTQTIIQGLGLLGLAGGAWRYFAEQSQDRAVRTEELAWRKTQFIIQLAADFYNDERTAKALKLLEGDPARLQRLVSTEVKELSDEELALVHCLDHYFDFFDRLHTFIFRTKTLTLDEASIFSGYLDVLEDQQVKDFAGRRGYFDAVHLHEAFNTWGEHYSRSGLLEKDRGDVLGAAVPT